MPPSSTALIFLPASIGNSTLQANATTSPTSILTTHISRTHTPKALGPYTLEHRLFVDTSSLVPGHAQPTRYTQFLTLSSQVPGKTYVGTSATTPKGTTQSNQPGNGMVIDAMSPSGEFTLITIPSQPHTPFPLLMQRMSPLWVPRQAHQVKGGVSFGIGDWKVRIGELRMLGGQGQGRIRGCLCEVELPEDVGDDQGSQEGIKELAKAFFESLIEGSGVDVGAMKVIGHVNGEGSQIVRQYMDLLKFARN